MSRGTELRFPGLAHARYLVIQSRPSASLTLGWVFNFLLESLHQDKWFGAFFQPNFKQLIHQTTRRWNRLNQRICLIFILLPYFIKIKNSIKPQSWGKISPYTGQKSDILPSLKLAIDRYTTANATEMWNAAMRRKICQFRITLSRQPNFNQLIPQTTTPMGSQSNSMLFTDSLFFANFYVLKLTFVMVNFQTDLKQFIYQTIRRSLFMEKRIHPNQKLCLFYILYV